MHSGSQQNILEAYFAKYLIISMYNTVWITATSVSSEYLSKSDITSAVSIL